MITIFWALVLAAAALCIGLLWGMARSVAMTDAEMERRNREE